MKKTKSDNSMLLLPIVIGTSIACVFSLAAVFLGAMLISREYVGESGVRYFQFVVYFFSALLGCFVTERMSSSNKNLACGITAAAYCVSLVGTSCLFFGGISREIWIGIVSVLAALLVTTLWISKPSTERKGRKRKITHR